jgi:hypothetical protein
MSIYWMAAAMWALVVLGVLHVVMGLVRFRESFAAVWREGVVGKFKKDDARRVAFWFTIAGPLLIAVGHLGVRAVYAADFEVVRIIGIYLFVTSMLGVISFPKSPFWATLVLSLVLLTGGYA